MRREGTVITATETSSGEQLAPSFDTLPDIARKLRNCAGRIQAREVYFFAITARHSRFVLDSCLDFGVQPGSLPPTGVAEALGEEIIARAVEQSLPLCWSGPAHDASPIVVPSRCRPMTTSMDEPGIALPLCSERGKKGIAIFLGEAIRADDDALVEIHAHCHVLFATVASLRSLDGGAIRRMSKRELECLKLTANGLTSEEIARELGLSVHTANQYLLNTTQKLNAVNRVHAVAKALRAGLIG